jgi:hypothetical protein
MGWSPEYATESVKGRGAFSGAARGEGCCCCYHTAATSTFPPNNQAFKPTPRVCPPPTSIRMGGLIYQIQRRDTVI